MTTRNLIITLLLLPLAFHGSAALWRVYKMRPPQPAYQSRLPVTMVQKRVKEMNEGDAGWISVTDIRTDLNHYIYAKEDAVLSTAPTAHNQVPISYNGGGWVAELPAGWGWTPEEDGMSGTRWIYKITIRETL